jgi:hypothetical protein
MVAHLVPRQLSAEITVARKNPEIALAFRRPSCMIQTNAKGALK